MSQGGWVAKVSGFLMVLYSRLNIIVQSCRVRRVLLGMIVANGVVWHTIGIAMVALS